MLSDFNATDPDTARTMLRPCLDVPRWVEEVAQHRPYASLETALDRARAAADPLTESEVTAALAHHPRIGERASGDGAEASLSRTEQSGLGLDDTVREQLEQANREYEARFDRVFLIRAAGRSSEEILAECRRRISNDPAAESREVAQQLREIAVLRLEGVLS